MNYANSINYQLTRYNDQILNTYELESVYNNINLSDDSDADLLDSSDESVTIESYNSPINEHNNTTVVNNNLKEEDNTSENDFTNFTMNVKMKKNLNSNCVICAEKIKKDDLISILMCNHHFHSNCILKWYELKKNCPICRCDVDYKNNIIDKLDEISGKNQYDKIEDLLKENLKKIKDFKKTYTKFNMDSKKDK